MPNDRAIARAPESKKLTIRRAKFCDMEAVAGFVRSSSDWYKRFIDEKDAAEHDVDAEWINKNYFRRDFYIGNNGCEDIGTISIQTMGGYAYLGYIYLDTKHVGKGYGHELMAFAQQCAKAQDLKGMVLIAHPDAKWAVKAYVKFGFEAVAKAKDDVLRWHHGALKPYYEEGFHLFRLTF